MLLNMVWDFKKEVGRKIIHLFSIIFLVIYLIFSSQFSEKIALFILAAMLVVMIHLEFMRIEQKVSIPILNVLWKNYRRPKEKNQLGGEVFFLIGAIICLAIFDTRIAAAAILMTTFGDLAAAIFGNRFGKHWITKDKAWEGVIAELVVNLTVGFFIIRTGLWKLTEISSFGDPIWSIIIIMALTATIVETFVRKMDDNLLIPVVSGFIGQLILMIITYLGMI